MADRELANQHLAAVASGHDADDIVFLTVRTNQSRLRMTQAARTRVFDGEALAATQRTLEQAEDSIAQRILVAVNHQKVLRVEKVVALRTSRDFAVSEPETAALRDVRRAGNFAELLASHEMERLFD